MGDFLARNMLMAIAVLAESKGTILGEKMLVVTVKFQMRLQDAFIAIKKNSALCTF